MNIIIVISFIISKSNCSCFYRCIFCYIVSVVESNRCRVQYSLGHHHVCQQLSWDRGQEVDDESFQGTTQSSTTTTTPGRTRKRSQTCLSHRTYSSQSMYMYMYLLLQLTLSKSIGKTKNKSKLKALMSVLPLILFVNNERMALYKNTQTQCNCSISCYAMQVLRKKDS